MGAAGESKLLRYNAGNEFRWTKILSENYQNYNRPPRVQMISTTRALARISVSGHRSSSHFATIPMAPPDAIMGLNDDYAKESNPLKVNVGIGAYRTDEGKPFVLSCVREAEGILAAQMASGELNQEYSGIAGCPEFVGNSIEFAYGNRPQNIQGVQTLSGTGGLRIWGEFLKKFHPHKNIYLPNPTWGNHIPIMANAGLEVRKYRYYDFEKRKVDTQGLLEDMDAASDGSCFLLHACAHNPTGYDLSKAEWGEISQLMKKKSHLPFFDCAYQGFASGNSETDAYSIRWVCGPGLRSETKPLLIKCVLSL